MPLITFVMPTAGREEFSQRFVHTLHKQTSEFALVAEDSKDQTLDAYYAKVNRLLDQVKTPYAMMVDNDDLVVWEGVLECIGWLAFHDDYVAAGGRIEGFRIRGNGPYGKVNLRTRLYSPFDQPVDYYNPDRPRRILAGFANSWSYYAVHRTEIMRQIWREIAAMNLSNLQLHEKFCAMRLLSLGYVMGFDAVSYCRQYGTSGQAHYKNNFPMRLMTDQFSKDRDAILDIINLCPADREVLIRLWADWWEAWLNRNYGPAASARKWAKRYFPAVVERIKNRPALKRQPPLPGVELG